MAGELGTTNLLLGVMAAVSVLEVLLLVGASIVMVSVYRRLVAVMDGLETRQISPTIERVNAILDDVKGVTAIVREETDRVDQAIRITMDRVDDTADRVRWTMRANTTRLVGFLRGLRVAAETILASGSARAKTPQPETVG